jgi:hypothetical protein
VTTPTTTTEMPVVDRANPFVLTAAHPAQIFTGDLTTSIGKFAVITIRTAGTTLSIYRTKEELDELIQLLQERSDAMTGLTVIRTPLPKG